MFTGIIEDLGEVIHLENEESNLHLTLRSSFTNELQIDQSVAHNGACLTVIKKEGEYYTVTAIDETLKKTNLSKLEVGEKVNLERCVRVGSRLDGHIVQGHVDQVGECINIEEQNGSWIFTFEYDPNSENITIEKGSITINGVSLTVINSKRNSFSVAIIPYTYEHTGFHQFKVGDLVNLEFDVVGKYVRRLKEFDLYN